MHADTLAYILLEMLSISFYSSWMHLCLDWDTYHYWPVDGDVSASVYTGLPEGLSLFFFVFVLFCRFCIDLVNKWGWIKNLVCFVLFLFLFFLLWQRLPNIKIQSWYFCLRFNAFTFRLLPHRHKWNTLISHVMFFHVLQMLLIMLW